MTYLQFSEPTQHAYKFYEVLVQSTQVTIRFGRIGEAGQTQIKSYATPEQAQAEADKKIREKLRKGYVRAQSPTPGTLPAPSPVPIPLPTAPSLVQVLPIAPSQSLVQAPLLWQFPSGSAAFGLFVSSEYCWVGNQQGRIFRLDLQGQMINQYQLPAGVKCLVEDDIWIYAGCDNGNVYDLTGKMLRLAYELEQKADIFWLDIHDGILAITDANGGLAKINPDGEMEWTRLSSGKLAWMVRADDQGFYHGHEAGVTLYDQDQGRQLWHQSTAGSVLFGWQDDRMVYAGTSGKKIVALDKATGAVQGEYSCDASVYSCATTEADQVIFAGDSAAAIYCFNRQGQRLWKLKTGCGSALSMQWLDQRLYLSTTEGALACVDVTPEAIQAALVGQLPPTLTHQTPSPQAVAAPAPLATTDLNLDQGVIVECIQQGSKLRIRAVSPGYHSDWMVQFPQDLREAGARYLVQELRQARQGNFYRAYGEITKLV